jgi:hypothetical protein
VFLLAAACSSEVSSAVDGAGGAAMGPTCGDAFLDCVTTCASDDAIPSERPVCLDSGRWQCPVGSFERYECPAGSCADRSNRFCCDPATGTFTRAPCGADGLRQACPAGQTNASDTSSTCNPPEITSACSSDLENQTCPVERHECHGAAGNCHCAASGDAGLAWSCGYNDPPP